MREILFRGKDRKTGEWVYGYYYTLNEYHFIRNDNERPESITTVVNSETVGEWTGLVDKNDVKIFEGDIVKSRNFVRQVVFNPATASYYIIGNEWEVCQIDSIIAQYWKVVGNIHDNPELLENIK